MTTISQSSSHEGPPKAWNGLNRTITGSRPLICCPNKAMSIFMAPGCEAMLKVDPVTAAWACMVNPSSVVFNFGKNAKTQDLVLVLAAQLGKVVAITTCHTLTKDLIAEVFFEKPEVCLKATSEGMSFNNSWVVASAGFDTKANLVKVNLYNIPVCFPGKDLLAPVVEAFKPYGKVVHLCAYLDEHQVFYGEASVFLNVSTVENPTPLHCFLHLGGMFNASVEICAKGLPPYCWYCHQEGHLKKDCPCHPIPVPCCHTCSIAGHKANDIECPSHPETRAAKKAAAEQHAKEIAAAEVEHAAKKAGEKVPATTTTNKPITTTTTTTNNNNNNSNNNNNRDAMDIDMDIALTIQVLESLSQEKTANLKSLMDIDSEMYNVSNTSTSNSMWAPHNAEHRPHLCEAIESMHRSTTTKVVKSATTTTKVVKSATTTTKAQRTCSRSNTSASASTADPTKVNAMEL